MDHIIEINRRSVFSLAEAQELLPVVFRITKSYSVKVDALIARLDTISRTQEEVVVSIETEVNSLIQEWQGKVQKLGALPKGLWIADFDSGDGYYCWKFPERSIEFWHRYSDGFSKRVQVADRRVMSVAPAPTASSSVSTEHRMSPMARPFVKTPLTLQTPTIID